MFSMPLAYPSSLDHRSPAAHIPRRSLSYVEELWSPGLAHGIVNSQAKADAYRLAHFQRIRRGPFSLRRGLNSIYVFFKLSITFGSDVD